MSRARKKKEAHKTVPILDWYDRALALGWPRSELDTLAGLIALNGRHEALQQVVEIKSSTIVLMVTSEYNFDRVVDGRTIIDRVAFVRHREWHWHQGAQSVQRTDVPRAPWCPLHDTACVPDEGGCGARDVTHRELCECPWTPHDWRNVKKVKMTVDHIADCPLATSFLDKPKAKRPEAAPHVYKAPEQVVKRPSRHNDWKLPGQTKLGL